MNDKDSRNSGDSFHIPFAQEIIFLIVLVILTFILLNPMHLFMPDMTVTLLLSAFFICFVVTSIFVWREHAHDEREALHRGQSGRVAYLLGSAVLVLGIMTQEIQRGVIDSFLVYALVAMILGKIITIGVLNNKN